MFKAYLASWMLHHWNFALNMCWRYADSGVLIDFRQKKELILKIVFGRFLFISVIFKLKSLIAQKLLALGQGCVSLDLCKILSSILSA